jgi:signal transduction histidine kinase/GAF domain-containing protein
MAVLFVVSPVISAQTSHAQFNSQYGAAAIASVDPQQTGFAALISEAHPYWDPQFSAMDRHTLRQSHVSYAPSTSPVVNLDSDSWARYKWDFIGLALAVLLEALLIILLLRSNFQRRKAERELGRMLAIERLECSLAASLIYLPARLVPAEIDRGFKQFIEFFAIDCISLFDFHQETAQFRLLRYQNMRGTPLRLSSLKPAEFKWTMDKLRCGQTVVVRTRADVPEEAANVVQALQRCGVHSFAGIPLTVDKRVVGALFFSSSKERDWDPTLLEELRMIAVIVGSGLERMRSRVALAESEQLKGAILSSLPFSITVLDNQGKVIAVNSRRAVFPCASNGHESIELGMDYLELCRRAADQGSQHARAALAGLQSVLAKISPFFEMDCASGVAPEERWLQVSAVPLSSKSGGVVIRHMDITERKLAGSDRKAAEAARADIAGSLLQAQEQERTRIARELHDDINQKLGLLAIDIQHLQQRTPQSNPEVHGELTDLFQKTNRISADVQHLSHQLHSSRLDYLGLPAALRRLCEEFGMQHHIFTECVIGEVPAKLAREIGLCLFRVAQECLTNVAKHSSASEVRVQLQRQGAAIQMEVRDNGCGFDVARVSAQREPGLGLMSIRERLRLVEGEVSIQSREGAGTKVTVMVPLHEEGATAQSSGFSFARIGIQGESCQNQK